MALTHRSLGGLAIVLTMGCALDGSDVERSTSPGLSVTPAGAGVSFGFGTQPSPAPRNVAGDSDRPTPLQTAGAPDLVTASPQVPGLFNFGQTPLGTFQQVTWTILNIGDAATGTLGINSSNAVDFAASAPFCQSLAPFQTCSVTITYQPQTLGNHAATFSITGFPLTYSFAGEGISSFAP